MNLRLAYAFLTVTLVPLAAYGILSWTPESAAVGFVYLAYALMILRFGRTGHRAYWEAAIASLLLDEKAAVLEVDVSTALRSARAITRGRSIEEVVQGILTSALEHAGSSRVVLVLQDEGAPYIAAEATPSWQKPPTAPIQPLDLLERLIVPVMTSGQPLIEHDLATRPDLQALHYIDQNGIQSVVVLPILRHGVASGCLYLERRHHAPTPSPPRVRVLEMLAAQAAISLENARFFDMVTTQERWLSTMLRCLNDAVITTDTEGRLTSCNPVAERLTGWSSDDALNQPLEDIFVLTEDQAEDGSVAEDTAARDARLRSRDGTTTFIAYSQSAIVSPEGEDMGGVLVFRDVSSAREMEARLRQSQGLESLGRLAGGVAHDFNNLLTVILTYTSLLRSAETDPAIQSDVDEIHSAAERARSLTRQLLAFSRQQVLTPKPLQINQVVDETRTLLERLLDDRFVLNVDLEPDLRPTLLDKVQFEQVLMNLVINARDAMPDGGQITIKTRSGSARPSDDGPGSQGETVRLDVSDTGHGMDAATRKRVFEPFFSTKPLGEGTGLGLSMVHGIVRQSNGTIDVESVVGEGTTFSIHLPLANQPAAHATEEDASANQDRTILLLEDNPSIRKLACHVLQTQGYRVIAGRNNQVTRLPTDVPQIDLLVTDLRPSEPNGSPVVKKWVERHPDLRILYMSGGPQGFEGRDLPPVLHKPFTPHQLASKVRLILD